MTISSIEKSTGLRIIAAPDDILNLAAYDPAKTVVVCTTEQQSEDIKVAGFYLTTLVASTQPTDEELEAIQVYCESINAVGCDAFYNMEKATYDQNSITADQEIYAPGQALVELIDSIENCDADKFNSVVKFSLNSLKSAAVKLSKILNQVDGDELWEVRAATFQKQVNELKEKIIELDVQNKQLASRAANATDNSTLLYELQQKQKDLESNNTLLTSKISEMTAQMAGMISKEESIALKQRADKAEAELEESNRKLQKYENDTHLFDQDDTAKDKQIAMLKEELAKQQSSQSNGGIDLSKLPLITQNTYLKAQKIIYLKEIKELPCMNALIQWLSVYSHSNPTVSRGISMLTIIYDRLDNNFRVQKYSKHKFAINTVPSKGIVVTNTLTQAFLNNVLNIRNYDLLVVIDRLGCPAPVVDRKEAEVYYLVDSVSDFDDFKLDPNKCLFFGDSGGKCSKEFTVNGELGNKAAKVRMYHMFNQNKWILPMLMLD